MAHWFGRFCAVVGEVGVFPQGLASSFSNFLPHIIERLHSFSDGCRFIAVTSTLKLSDPTTPVSFPSLIQTVAYIGKLLGNFTQGFRFVNFITLSVIAVFGSLRPPNVDKLLASCFCRFWGVFVLSTLIQTLNQNFVSLF